MKRMLLATGLMLCVHVALAQTSPSIAVAKNAETKKIETLLKKTAYEPVKLDSNIWSVSFKGIKKPEHQVVITQADGLTIFFCIIQIKATDSLATEKRLAILKYNMDFDRVKIGIDDEDSLMVRVDVSSRIIDLKELEINIEQVSAAADEIVGLLL